MSRRIDHLVIAVRDLDGAASFYRRLGFQVGARNRHPWGTENRIVQFRSSFLELITVGEGAEIASHAERSFSFGAFVRDYLSEREGLAMLVLDSADAQADAQTFSRQGIGAFEPFRFERRGVRPDGTEVRVAFSLAFATLPDAPRAGFFVCQQHYPENFWNPAFQVHDNRAEDVSAVALSAPDPDRCEAFLSAFTGERPVRPALHDLSYRLRGGHLDAMTPDDAGETYGSVEAELDRPSFVAFSVRIDDVARQARWLDAAEIPYAQIGTRVVVPASAAMGVAIAFEAT
ncbi:VOC family protein [Microvirga thermotolerans]|uniref:VOC family protein n=1 Tax=Microvirga thermotolerans TaxID=2651334 RepID=A0A5P9JVH0_9HYPH|nr:VOC family protein [Microvirga thermotolerans]QFU16433.1 VOC family protein [Microvirga thermotolerans]